MLAFIFDLDGTLLDTLADIGRACNAVLKRHGLPLHAVDDYRKMVGNGFARLVCRAIPPELADTIDEKDLAAMVGEAKEYYACHMTMETKAYAGIESVLHSMEKSGAVLGVYSNKPDPLTVNLIKHYFPDTGFSFVQGARPAVPLKPAPDVLLALMAAHGLDLEKTFYVGDSDVDMLLAQNAGVTGVGAAWGFRGPAELTAAGAAKVLHRPADLSTMLRYGQKSR